MTESNVKVIVNVAAIGSTKLQFLSGLGYFCYVSIRLFLVSVLAGYTTHVLDKMEIINSEYSIIEIQK